MNAELQLSDIQETIKRDLFEELKQGLAEAKEHDQNKISLSTYIMKHDYIEISSYHK